MTIVLQHQFWDLMVTEDGFEVGMSFGGIPERVAVPFAAVKGFVDPSVEFGLRFEEISETQERVPETGNAPLAQGAERTPAEHKAPRTPPALAAVPTPANPEPSATTPSEGPDKPPGGGEVVRLDRFRKK
jgi:hypothetical protein